MVKWHQPILRAEGLDIFFIEEDDKNILVYAPLAGIIICINHEEAEKLRKTMAGRPSTADSIEIWNMLQEKNPVMECATPENITELTILLNQRCNFSCSYCYSARGRSDAELSTDQIRQVLDFFVIPNRGSHLRIVFSGGGDPVLSFDRFREAVDYLEKLSFQKDIAIEIDMVTNGSTLSDTFIGFLKDHHVHLVLSFDILKEVHNRQRSHFDTVVNTLFRMTDAGLSFGLRCTITPLNVSRQYEMVEELHRKYPQIRSAAFETVLSREIFESAKELSDFYEKFVTHYFEARSLGKQYGISIGNTIFNSVECCKPRSCLGKLVVTPDGSLTACSRISVPKEPHYDLFRYGKVDSYGVQIDYSKYNILMNENVSRYSECHNCIARWHCGGGCLLAREILTERMSAYCHFMRMMIVETLKYRIRNEC